MIAADHGAGFSYSQDAVERVAAGDVLQFRLVGPFLDQRLHVVIKLRSRAGPAAVPAAVPGDEIDVFVDGPARGGEVPQTVGGLRLKLAAIAGIDFEVLTVDHGRSVTAFLRLVDRVVAEAGPFALRRDPGILALGAAFHPIAPTRFTEESRGRCSRLALLLARKSSRSWRTDSRSTWIEVPSMVVDV